MTIINPLSILPLPFWLSLHLDGRSLQSRASLHPSVGEAIMFIEIAGVTMQKRTSDNNRQLCQLRIVYAESAEPLSFM
jgi:hypothetical protein